MRRRDAEGVLHHIIVRGIERRAVFREDTGRDRFTERVWVLLDSYAIDPAGRAGLQSREKGHAF